MTIGAAEWAAMSEKERQAELLRRRLEQKRLMREGRLEEAARVLGEGFEVDANLKKLMGQNRARYVLFIKLMRLFKFILLTYWNVN